MEKNGSILVANKRLARKINREARANPKSPYAHKFVGIANGKVAIVADSWRDVVDRLKEVEPDSSKCQYVEASANYDEVIEI